MRVFADRQRLCRVRWGRLWDRLRLSSHALFGRLFGAPIQEQLWALTVPVDYLPPEERGDHVLLRVRWLATCDPSLN